MGRPFTWYAYFSYVFYFHSYSNFLTFLGTVQHYRGSYALCRVLAPMDPRIPSMACQHVRRFEPRRASTRTGTRFLDSVSLWRLRSSGPGFYPAIGSSSSACTRRILISGGFFVVNYGLQLVGRAPTLRESPTRNWAIDLDYACYSFADTCRK